MIASSGPLSNILSIVLASPASPFSQKRRKQGQTKGSCLFLVGIFSGTSIENLQGSPPKGKQGQTEASQGQQEHTVHFLHPQNHQLGKTECTKATKDPLPKEKRKQQKRKTSPQQRLIALVAPHTITSGACPKIKQTNFKSAPRTHAPSEAKSLRPGPSPLEARQTHEKHARFRRIPLQKPIQLRSTPQSPLKTSP